MATSFFRNKDILITAGPTWVPIDSVRVISNIATGKTGILLARKLQAQGAGVTLLLGPVEAYCLNKKINLLRFRFFDDFKNKFIAQLKTRKYDIVIHTAAVSDYKPEKVFEYKIKSNKRIWNLKLVPTLKIIERIKKIDPSVFLVAFKFETNLKKGMLIERARSLFKRANPDLVVANTINKNQYTAYVLNYNDIHGPLINKESMAKKLISLIAENR